MSDPDDGVRNSVLLIGGPDAGKSNFLFRLWIAIDAGSGSLLKDGLPAEVEYLRAGAERLLEGEFAGHTSKEVHERVVIPIRDAAGARGTLVVPDVPGEQVLSIFRNRQWSQAWEELISSKCACLMFVRAGSDEIVAPLDWATCFDKYQAVLTPSAAPSAGAPSPAPDPAVVQPDDDRSETPTQVILTDWLQFLRRAFTEVVGGSFRPRVGIVVTAWDAVPIDQQSAGPAAYLKDNLPMLYQFVLANVDRFDFELFGVSIVAGDLKNDEEFREEYLKGKPRDFGYVLHSLAGPLTRSPDVILPVAWALRVSTPISVSADASAEG